MHKEKNYNQKTHEEKIFGTTQNEVKYDMIKKPYHYTAGKVDCLTAMKESQTREEYLGFIKLSAFKYLWRSGKKHSEPLQDLENAKFYIDLLCNELRNEKTK